MPTILTDEQTVATDEFKRRLEQKQPALQPIDGHPLITMYVRAMNRLDLEMDELYEQRFVGTATGEELERIGRKYNIQRKTGEGNEKLRKRIEAARNVARSRGTYQDIARVATKVLDASPEEITLMKASDTDTDGTAIIQARGGVLDDSPFSNTEIGNILSRAAFGGHRIVVEQEDAFRFDDPNNGWGTEWANVIS